MMIKMIINVKKNIKQVLMMIVGAETPADLDAISKWLDIAGNKLDYRRYGEVQLRVKTILDLQQEKILTPTIYVSWSPPW